MPYQYDTANELTSDTGPSLSLDQIRLSQWLQDAVLQLALANGGESGIGGSAGQGIGGGIYNLGSFAFDAFTVIRHNHASTSNDDVFGI